MYKATFKNTEKENGNEKVSQNVEKYFESLDNARQFAKQQQCHRKSGDVETENIEHHTSGWCGKDDSVLQIGGEYEYRFDVIIEKI